MDFTLSDDQKMIQETASSFVKKESPVERARKLREDERGWDPAVWKRMGELGWLGLPLPEDVGGFGGTMIDAAILLEQFGTTLVPEPYVPSVVLAGSAVAAAGSEAQKAELLGPMLEGDTTLALAWAERQSRYDPCDVLTRAERRNGGYVLTGEKVWVENGHAADHLIVSARVGGGQRDRDGVALFAVAKGASGVTIRSARTMDGRRAALVSLDAAEAQLLSEERGADALEHALDRAAAGICAEGVGVVHTVLWMTVEYLKTRKQFGVPIGVFQALQHRAVDMFVEVELCRSASILASGRADDRDREVRRHAISAAKVQLARGGFFVVSQGTQLHGGIGVTDEHDISLYFKRLRAVNALYGDEQHHVERFMSAPSFVAGVV